MYFQWKPVSTLREVRYNEERWRLLRRLRGRAIDVMAGLDEQGLSTILHGSVARGDVNERSDVDVLVPYQIPSFRVEHALAKLGCDPLSREVIQATPFSVIKAYITLDETTTVSFPLTRMTVRERGFYRFGGEITLDGLRRGIRVPGVSKGLTLIKPTPYGHDEGPVIGHESEVAKVVGVDLDVVRERVRVLTRRRQIGRTGVFLKQEVPQGKTVEQVVKELVRGRRLLLRGAI